MRLEDQVCSLELAKKLKELGVKQEAAFHWRYSDLLEEWSLFRPTKDVTSSKPFYAAFTVAELGELLPNSWEGTEPVDETWATKPGRWVCSWDNETFYADTEADARARMMIYLIENGIVKP